MALSVIFNRTNILKPGYYGGPLVQRRILYYLNQKYSYFSDVGEYCVDTSSHTAVDNLVGFLRKLRIREAMRLNEVTRSFEE